MGFDLYSKRRPKGKDKLYYRFNIHGWGSVQDFLSTLGCDLSEFSGCNDGDLVSAETCADIAGRIHTALDEGRLAEGFAIEAGEKFAHGFGCAYIKYTDEDGNISHIGLNRDVFGSNDKEKVDPKECWEAEYKGGVVLPPEKMPKEWVELQATADKDLAVLLAEAMRLEAKNGGFHKLRTIERTYAEARLAGRGWDPSKLIVTDLAKIRDPKREGDYWSRLGYYIGFGDFCLGCSKLGGFQQF
jgi:hypothetical protein